MLLAAMAALVGLAGCERPPVESVQRGYRGTGMDLVYNPRLLAEQAADQASPAPLPAAPSEGPKAREVYQNVKVLGDLSVGEFVRTMTAMTAWVAPEQGCVHCHNPANFADDSLYTKIVSRRMLQMTQTINSDWKAHVGDTGVTCYTCHRGHNVPKEVWFAPLAPRGANGFAGERAGQNAPAPTVGLASLPNDPFTPFLLAAEPIRVQGETALPEGNRHSIKQAEWTFGLMVHMSKSLGVNCAQCHNSRAFSDWDQSSPQRLTAWHGIRMARALNNEFMVPLTDTFPANRKGPGGDVAKMNCATCHQGAHKPLYGASLLGAHPELQHKTWLPAGAAKQAALQEADAKALEQLAKAAASLPGDAAATAAAPAPALR